MKKMLLWMLNAVLCLPMWVYYKSRTIRIFLKARLPRGARVLDIGSGHNPWFRSNVLLDRFVDDQTERCGPILTGGREFVEGDATNLPFPDKSFDFVYCSHIAEHIDDIAQFFGEIQRVGKAGYIETPNYLFEQMVGTTTHTWALWVQDGVLHAERKWVPGAPARVYHSMHHLAQTQPLLGLAFSLIPDLSVMRFWWENRFDYELHEAPTPMEPTRAALGR
jgi:SAM-dependent methyltransferase